MLSKATKRVVISYSAIDNKHEESTKKITHNIIMIITTKAYILC